MIHHQARRVDHDMMLPPSDYCIHASEGDASLHSPTNSHLHELGHRPSMSPQPLSKQQRQQPLMHMGHVQYPTFEHYGQNPDRDISKHLPSTLFHKQQQKLSCAPPSLQDVASNKLIRSHSQSQMHRNYASPPPPPQSTPSIPISMSGNDYHRHQHKESAMESDGSHSDNDTPDTSVQWTRQEDILLREAVVKFSGKAWKRIAEYCFPDGFRDKDQCLQRWRMISRPRSIKGPWTPEEDRQLRGLVSELGAEKWVLIANRLGSRTGKQCRERWHNHLDPTIDKSPFTPEENELILTLHEKLGSKWAEMSKLMPGRPDNAIKNHFNTSMQRQRRRLSLQDPSELQMKFSEGSGPSTLVMSPLASPTSTTSSIANSPSTARGHRFDPYERRHSMPCLGMPEKMQSHQPSADGQQDGTPLRSILTPPKTPEAKLRLQFSPSMSRSSSLGSACRPSLGQNRPSPLVSPSTHKSGTPYFASGSSAMGPSRPSSSPLSPHFPGRLARASSVMSLSTSSGRQSPYSSYSGEQGYGYFQQEQQLHHSLPRPNLTRHESLRHHHHHNYSRQNHHERHRSPDTHPFSALAELANVAEQHRDLRTTTAIVAPKKETMDEDNCKVQHDAMESTMTATMVAKPASAGLTRRFPTLLSNLKEEEHPEEHGHGFPTRTQHSYHIDQRSEQSNNFHNRPGLNGRSSSSPTPPKASTSSFYHSAEDSMDYSASENGGSDREQDPVDSQPNAACLAMRRGSIRDLMAIDNLCLTTEEMERC